MDVSTLTVTTGEGKRKLINHLYRVLRKIGQGQYGKVLLALVDPASPVAATIHAPQVAIKTIHRMDKLKLITKAYLLQSTKIMREILIMKGTRHPNVVKLYQVIDDMRFDKILLVLEYCSLGEIDWKRYNHYHEKYKPVADKKPRLTIEKILRDVVAGLAYLHRDKNIIHRDLKPLNLLVLGDHTVKISDFGVSLILENNANDARELARTMGTPAFFAPELCQFVHKRMSALSGTPALDLLGLAVSLTEAKKAAPEAVPGGIDKRIDLWLLGVVLYTLFYHEVPFNGRNEFELFKNIVRKSVTFPPVVKLKRTNQGDVDEMGHLKSLIVSLLQKDPAQRASIEDIVELTFTTFDLDLGERRAWIESMQPDDGDTLFGEKIRLWFRGKKDKDDARPETPTPGVLPGPRTFPKLEAVDDLLDLYLDSSLTLSYGSDVETEPVDSLNVLGALDSFKFGPVPAPDEPKFERIKTSRSNPGLLPIQTSSPIKKDALQPKSSHGSPRRTGAGAGLATGPLTELSERSDTGPVRRLVALARLATGHTTPPVTTPTRLSPQKGVYLHSHGSTSSLPRSRQGSTNTPPAPVTIGARSPGTFAGLFSPARKYFSRSRRGSASSVSSKDAVAGPADSLGSGYAGSGLNPDQVAAPPGLGRSSASQTALNAPQVALPTILALSLPPTKQRKPVTDLAPPPAFAIAALMGKQRLGLVLLARLSALVALLAALVALLARLLPQVPSLPFGGALNRITLLLLLLNLNAYLTDGWEPRPLAPASGDADATFIANVDSDSDGDSDDDTPPPPPPHATLMADYLSRLP